MCWQQQAGVGQALANIPLLQKHLFPAWLKEPAMSTHDLRSFVVDLNTAIIFQCQHWIDVSAMVSADLAISLHSLLSVTGRIVELDVEDAGLEGIR